MKYEGLVAGETIKLAFMERTTPTIIRSGPDDVPASGAIWIRPADGAVVRTSLTVTPPPRHDAIRPRIVGLNDPRR